MPLTIGAGIGGNPLSSNTLTEFISQYASMKADGLFCTKALQLVAFEAHVED